MKNLVAAGAFKLAADDTEAADSRAETSSIREISGKS